jgi:molecular chaperone DnaK
MQENINFGIDLGTTNSAIGQYINGRVNVLKNPRGFKEILPSAVAFKKGKVLVGDKALEYLTTNPEGVFTAFKRDMGTDRTYEADTGEGSVTPFELSKYVLQEVLGFVQDETVTSAVITIPASFDTVQSNATKKAGHLAGLSEVVLLQEPVAACLAYANENNLDIDTKQTWLVYDFGGGTFDSALVEIDHREMKVKDHLGNNFLGGVDIDNAILKTLVYPKIYAQTGSSHASDGTDRPVRLQYRKYLLHLIEEAKKELSVSASATLEVNFAALSIETDIVISREEFNNAVMPFFNESVQLLKELMNTNNISFHEISRVVLVGGTTYIPLIREGLKQLTGAAVDSSIDPTTAIVKGAAYFAGTRQKAVQAPAAADTSKDKQLDISLFFENTSNDAEELISLKSENSLKAFMRIQRADGGHDSGLKEFKDEASEFVPLLPKQVNHFVVSVLDKKQNIVFRREISISQGIYSISGQTLPLDICLEVDSDDGTSHLEPIFKKNSVLPLKKTMYKSLSKSVSSGSSDSIFINVLEGRRGTMPGSNLSIGFISINGNDISSDLIRGTDIELNFSISESRDLEIEVYIPSTDLLLKETFNPHTKVVVPEKLLKEIDLAVRKASKEMTLATEMEQYELASRFQKISGQLQALKEECREEHADPLFRVDEKKRALLRELDGINRSKHIFEELEAFHETKAFLLEKLPGATPDQASQAKKILAEEKDIINSGDKQLIKKATKKMGDLINAIYFQSPDSFLLIFLKMKVRPESDFKDYKKVQQLIAEGDIAMQNKDYVLLKNICYIIGSLMIPEKKSGNDKLFDAITGLK